MYGNTPHAGRVVDEEPTDRRAFREDVAALTAATRDLLPDEFVVGAEIVDDADGLKARVAVQPPVGSVVSAGLAESEEVQTLAHDLAAGAALQAKHAGGDLAQTAR